MTEKEGGNLVEKLKATTLSSDQQTTISTAYSLSVPTTMSRSYTVHGISTDIWVQLFADRIVLGVSQLGGKVGNFLLCQADQSEINPRAVEFQVTNLLGAREDPLLAVYARRITERIVQVRPPSPAESYPTILLGISVDKERGKDPEMFRSLVDLLVQLYVDSTQTQ